MYSIEMKDVGRVIFTIAWYM